MAELPITVTYDGEEGDVGLTRLMDIVSGGLAVAFGEILAHAVEGAAAALTKFVGQAAEAEVQQAGLVALLNSTGGAAGLTQEAVNQLANQFRDLAGGSDEAVVAIEEIGIRSGAVSAQQMPQFIQAVLDLGTVMGSTTTAAELLARAQEDPLGAFTRLERQTGVYDQALKANIETMVKHGDTAGAVAQIMEYVARTTGGSAAAAADTLSGKWSILTNHFEDFFKALAEHVLPVIERLLDVAIPVLDAVYASFENTFIPLIDDAAAWGEGIINALASGMASAAQAVVDVINQIGAIIASWMAPGSPPRFLPDLDKWGEEAINVYMGGWANFDRSVFDELYKAIKAGLPTEEIHEYADATKALSAAQDELNSITEHYDSLISPLSSKLKAIQGQQQKLRDADELARLRMIINSNTGWSASAKQQAALQIQEILTREQIDALQDEKNTAVGAAKEKVDAAKSVADKLKEQIDLQLQFTQATGSGGAAGAAHALAGALEHIKAAAGGAGGAFAPISSAMNQLKADVALNADAIKGKIDGFIGGIQTFVGNLQTSLAGLGNFLSPITTALEDARQAFLAKLPEMQANWNATWELIKADLEIIAPQVTADVRSMVTDIGTMLDGLVTLWRDHFGTLSTIQNVFTTVTITTISILVTDILSSVKIGLNILVGLFKLAFDVITGNVDGFVKDFTTTFNDVLNTAVDTANTDLRLIAKAFGLNFNEIVGTVGGAVDQIMKAVNDAMLALKGLWDFITGHDFNVNVSIPGLPPQRAAGGPVDSGMPYLVGERGPELFVPSNNGTILPHGSGAAVTINIDARGSNDPDAIEEAGYAGAQRALAEAGYRSDQLLRMGAVGA